MYNSFLCSMFFKLLFAIALAGRHDLYEGSSCTLEGNGAGVCKKLHDCPPILKEVQEGTRDSVSTGRCGFDDFTEIVCCPSNAVQKVVRRSSDIACEEYQKTKDGLEQEFYIVVHGGYASKPGEFPFAVALGFPNDLTEDEPNPVKYSCGGTLISYEHVLTAAHCVRNIQELVPTVVLMGALRLDENGTSIRRIGVSKVIVHPQYKRSTIYNDVAILKLKERIPFTTNIQPACIYNHLPKTAESLDSHELIVVGWGATSTDVDKSQVLLRTPSLRMINKTACNPHYKQFARLPNGIVDSLICIKDPDENRNADGCNGDSGGPLILKTPEVKYVIGITAFGQHCGSSVPGVYTSIYPYLEWIEKQVWG